MPQRRQRPGRSAAERALAERDSLKLNGPSMAWKQRTLKERAIDDAFPNRITASHAPATMPARVSSRKPRPATAGTAERRGTPSGASITPAGALKAHVDLKGKRLAQRFAHADRDKSGALDRSEVDGLLRVACIPPELGEQFMRQVDADADGKITCAAPPSPPRIPTHRGARVPESPSARARESRARRATCQVQRVLARARRQRIRRRARPRPDRRRAPPPTHRAYHPQREHFAPAGDGRRAPAARAAVRRRCHVYARRPHEEGEVAVE